MKVLWFEITTPSRYNNDGRVVSGWQDSLEQIVSSHSDVDLYIAFESRVFSEKKDISNVHYIPLHTHYSWLDSKKAGFDQFKTVEKVIPLALNLINDVQPDIIHVFGNEWPFGLVAEKCNIPVIIHIQGSIVSYNNSLYPPKYNEYTLLKHSFFSPKLWWKQLRMHYYNKSRVRMETQIWKCVKYYMGRTDWDYALSQTLHPNSVYYRVEEAIRPVFLKDTYLWRGYNGGKIKIISTGISFWKGADVILKTAHVLKTCNVDFEWIVAGKMDDFLLSVVEKTESLSFIDNNVNILGFIQPDDLIKLLCDSTLYVHTAYIENSPNSICEAQLIGIPVVATYVGGVHNLVENKVEGLLVPANDPWQMAQAIIDLVSDKDRMKVYSENSRKRALVRHNPDNIYKQLMDCYQSVLNKN